MKITDKISWLMGRVQRSLVLHLNQCLPTPLTAQEERLVSIPEIIQVERHVPRSIRPYRYPGRKPLDRQACARAFVAKALNRHPTISDLRRALQSAGNLRQICGFTTSGAVPSEPTSPRAFAEFAASGLSGRVNDTLVKEYLAQELAGHISRDSTAIVGREKPAKKMAREPRKQPRKRGRPAKDEQREPAIDKRLDRQMGQGAEEAIRELPVACDRGTKKNAKGYKLSWNGDKLHQDINDIGLPISALVTSASLHDSQAAIPLITLTSGKVTCLYDLMDAAYDAKRHGDKSEVWPCPDNG